MTVPPTTVPPSPTPPRGAAVVPQARARPLALRGQAELHAVRRRRAQERLALLRQVRG